MTIAYQNRFGETITENQALLNSDFTKTFSDNGILKKEEEYMSGDLTLVTYYKATAESETAIVQQIMADAPQQALMVKEYQVLSPVFKKELSRSYEPPGTLVAQFRFLYKNGNLVCSQQLENVSGSPIVEFTKKFYYNDALVADGPAFIASYKADGTLNYIEYNSSHEYDSKAYDSSNIDQLRDYLCWTVAEMDYYMTATFEP